MGSSFRLGDADRERFGCPEWLPVDLTACTIAEVTELSDRFGFELEDWPDALFGEVPFEFAGEPDADKHRRKPRWWLSAYTWFGLHQAGIDASWDDVGKIAILQIGHRDDESPGKAPAPEPEAPPPDPTPEPSTTQPSSTSSPA